MNHSLSLILWLILFAVDPAFAQKDELPAADEVARNFRVLEFKSSDFVKSKRFFDIETGLLIQSTMGEGDAETKYSFEYNNPGNDGVKFVSKITSTIQGKPRFAIEIDSVNFDPELTDESFTMAEGLTDLPDPDYSDR